MAKSLGMLGPNGAGKTSLFGIIDRHARARQRACRLRRSRHHPRLPAADRCRMGHCALLPGAAALRRHDGVREPRRRRGFREERCSESEVYGLSAAHPRRLRTARTRPTCKAEKLTLLDRKRLELARALATRPRVLLLDEVAGGLSEVECETLVSLVRRIRETGVSMIWIEHVVHALWPWSTGSSSSPAASSSPTARRTRRSHNPKVVEVYMGIPSGE